MKPSLPRVVILELNTPGNMLTQVSELPTFPKEFAKLAEDQTLQNDDEAVRGVDKLCSATETHKRKVASSARTTEPIRIVLQFCITQGNVGALTTVILFSPRPASKRH